MAPDRLAPMKAVTAIVAAVESTTHAANASPSAARRSTLATTLTPAGTNSRAK
jgi:hypothetical protein